MSRKEMMLAALLLAANVGLAAMFAFAQYLADDPPPVTLPQRLLRLIGL